MMRSRSSWFRLFGALALAGVLVASFQPPANASHGRKGGGRASVSWARHGCCTMSREQNCSQRRHMCEERRGDQYGKECKGGGHGQQVAASSCAKGRAGRCEKSECTAAKKGKGRSRKHQGKQRGQECEGGGHGQQVAGSSRGKSRTGGCEKTECAAAAKGKGHGRKDQRRGQCRAEGHRREDECRGRGASADDQHQHRGRYGRSND